MPPTLTVLALMNNSRAAEEAEDLEECNERLELIAEYLKIQFVVETKEEEYTTIFGNKKMQEVETLVIKPL